MKVLQVMPADRIHADCCRGVAVVGSAQRAGHQPGERSGGGPALLVGHRGPHRRADTPHQRAQVCAQTLEAASTISMLSLLQSCGEATLAQAAMKRIICGRSATMLLGCHDVH